MTAHLVFPVVDVVACVALFLWALPKEDEPLREEAVNPNYRNYNHDHSRYNDRARQEAQAEVDRMRSTWRIVLV